MFTGLTLPDYSEQIRETDKADGFVHLCDQSALMFGQDRKDPISTRPVVRVREYNGWAVVLPCTSKDPSTPEDFFELTTNNRVFWIRPLTEKKSFAFYRYEPVLPSKLKTKIGTMPQPARIELIRWLQQKL